jgi:hypothetical protein
LTTNGVGLRVHFGLGVGSSLSGTAGAWAGSAFISATGAVSVVGTNGATFYITGVQLEKGSTATSFDYRDYGRELALCQRYYEKSYGANVVPGTSTTSGIVSCSSGFSGTSTRYFVLGGKKYAVQKRTAPTLTFYAETGTEGRISKYNASETTVSISSTSGGGDTSLPNFITGATGDTTVPYIFHFAANSEL